MPLVVLIVLPKVVRPAVLVPVPRHPCLALRVLALFLVRLVASLRLVCLVRVDLFVSPRRIVLRLFLGLAMSGRRGRLADMGLAG